MRKEGKYSQWRKLITLKPKWKVFKNSCFKGEKMNAFIELTSSINNFQYFSVFSPMLILTGWKQVFLCYSFALYKSSGLLFHNWTTFFEEANGALGTFISDPSLKVWNPNGSVWLSKLRQGTSTNFYLFCWDIGAISRNAELRPHCRLEAGEVATREGENRRLSI